MTFFTEKRFSSAAGLVFFVITECYVKTCFIILYFCVKYKIYYFFIIEKCLLFSKNIIKKRKIKNGVNPCL